MEYQVKLSNGDKFNMVDDNFDIHKFTEQFDDSQMSSVIIGESVIVKRSFISLIPTYLIVNE